jgi:hypothetical protein
LARCALRRAGLLFVYRNRSRLSSDFVRKTPDFDGFIARACCAAHKNSVLGQILSIQQDILVWLNCQASRRARTALAALGLCG